MEKEFIPYKQALDLKELGFDEPCLACVGENNEVIIRVGDYRSFSNKKPEDIIERDFYNNIITDFNSYANDTASAPTFSQAFRWFREKYELFFNIYSSDPARNDVYWNIYIFGKTKNRQDIKLEYVSMIYEQAELECLKKLIEIVKEK